MMSMCAKSVKNLMGKMVMGVQNVLTQTALDVLRTIKYVKPVQIIMECIMVNVNYVTMKTVLDALNIPIHAPYAKSLFD